MPRPETTEERRKRQSSQAFKDWRRQYRASNSEALNLARNMQVPLHEARAHLAQIETK